MLGYAVFTSGPPLSHAHFQENTMGKGDTRTRKGKIYNHSYGNARPHGTAATVKTVTPKAPVVAAKKAPARKKA
jgi:30S ribosomal protein S31